MQIDLEDKAGVFNVLIEESPMPIALYVGEDMIIQVANRAMLKAWGKEASVIGKPLAIALPELQGQPFLQILNEVRRTGKAYEAKEDLVKLATNGILETFYFDFTYKPLKDDLGQVWGILNNATNVTELVNAKLQVKESEALFRKMIQDAPIAIGILRGKDFIIEQANAELLKLWGKSNRVIGRTVAAGLPELIGQPFIDILKGVYQTGENYDAEQQETRLLLDGKLKKRWYNFTYKPLRNANGIYAILHVAIDVTKQVQLQQQKDEFLGIASHELKTPVTSIKAYAQVLERMIRSEGDDKKADMVRRMDLQLNRLTGLIADLLDVTKIQSGKMTFNPVQFDFDLAIEEIVEEMQHTTSKHRIQTNLKSQCMVFADRERIGQVVANFLSNAIKYSTDNDNIDVKSYLKENEVVLSVRDYGIGISTKLQHLVFDQFYRVSGNLQHTYPGLGLGLYISAEIIKNEGGRIWVESEEGKGSTFFFALKT